MSNTTTTYLSIANNLARYQKLEAAAAVGEDRDRLLSGEYRQGADVDQFVGNYRLLSYALQAYGLGDQINNTALIKQVLEQGTSSPHALANTLPNANWKAFANAFNFSASGAGAPSSSTLGFRHDRSDYVEQQLEAKQGAERPRRRARALFRARRADR